MVEYQFVSRAVCCSTLIDFFHDTFQGFRIESSDESRKPRLEHRKEAILNIPFTPQS